MSSRRERLGGSPREFSNLTRREEILLRNHDRARRRPQVRATMERESVETAERIPRTDREELRFDRKRSLRERRRIAQRRRSELIARRPERRHTDNAHFREPIVSHRIVGRDVDVNEDRMLELFPAPDPDLHMRTWRSLNRVYPKASIVEMVQGLDREEYMEFARIIMTGLPVASIGDMRRRGMMEDIEHVAGGDIVRDSHQGYEDDFSQGYDHDHLDQSDLEDELVSNAYSDDVEIPSIPKRHLYRKFSPAADIYSDDPMDDYVSTDDDENNLHSQFIPKSVCQLRRNSRSKLSHASEIPLEFLRQSDENEEGQSPETCDLRVLPPTSVVASTLLSKQNPRSYNNISTEKLKIYHDAEIHRFRECMATAQQAVAERSRADNKVLHEHCKNGALLVESLTYKAMLQNVFDILLKSDPIIPPVDNREPQLQADIPSNIYMAIKRANCEMARPISAWGRVFEAHKYLDISRVFEAEIRRRTPFLSASQGVRDAAADIKFEMACVAHNQTRQKLEKVRTTNSESYTTMIKRIERIKHYGLSVAAYTNNMGSSASLLIWPSMAVQDVTHLPMIRTTRVFLDGISNFIKGSHEFQAIQNLIDHLSTWFEGWMTGSISSEMAKELLEAFLKTCGNCGPLRKEQTTAQISYRTPTPDEPGNELEQLIEMFSEIPRADNATYSTVGTTGHEMSLNITDMQSLKCQRQLTERAIEAVLATTKFPEGVMFARASGYGTLYDQQDYEHERSMLISQGVKTILCPVHTGNSTQHWVGVVVRLESRKGLRPGISMILLDSMATDTNSSVYDEQTIKKIVLTWLRHRLPDFKSFAFNGHLARPRVQQQEDLNSCGVHMLLNLRAVGLGGKYVSKGGNCTSKEWIDDARESFVKRILRSAGRHLGGDIESTISELLDESGVDHRPVLTSNASASRVVSPHLGS